MAALAAIRYYRGHPLAPENEKESDENIPEIKTLKSLRITQLSDLTLYKQIDIDKFPSLERLEYNI